VRAANLRIKFAEDFSPRELEQLQDYISRLLDKKRRSDEEGGEEDR
jgi:hypothetical protein